MRTLLFLLLLGLAQTVHADERILSFDSTITVNQDGTLQVRETITVQAEGRDIRRGIFRDFPTIYPREGGGQVSVGFAFVDARRDGAPEPWRVENRGNGVRVYVGSPQSTVSHGTHRYELNYRTDRQMGFFADHDELYWNATGNGWGFVIDHATARVLLPADIPREQITLEAYTGRQGTRGRDYAAALEDGMPLFTTTQRLEPYQGLTIVVMWPKGFIMPGVESAQPLTSPASSPGYSGAGEGGPYFDSPAEAILRRQLPRDDRPVFFGLTALALLIGYYYLVWSKVGRDPPARIIVPEYQMPQDLSPAAMRYLLQMRYDNKCFAAAILSLAVKGYLHIEQSAGILGLGRKFSLRREAGGSNTPLSRDESALLNKLFLRGDVLELEK